MQRLISSRNARVVVGSSTQTFRFEQPRKKKSNGVKSHDPGGQFRSPKRESARPGNVSRGDWIVSSAVWRVASSRWNHVSAASMSSNFGRKNRVIASRYRAPLTVAARPASFSKKYDPMMPSAQNPRQTVTRCGCVCFSLIARGFSQTRQFCRLTKPSRWKCASSLRIIYLSLNSI